MVVFYINNSVGGSVCVCDSVCVRRESVKNMPFLGQTGTKWIHRLFLFK